MNQLASTCEGDDDNFMSMFENDDSSHCLDLELKKLNEESTQMGHFVHSIEERTKEDIIHWQKVLEDSQLDGRATFLQRLSNMVTPRSESSPMDEKTVNEEIEKAVESNLQTMGGDQKEHRYRSWITWFKDWAHGNCENDENKQNPEKWAVTDSDSEGLLVMNSIIMKDDEEMKNPNKGHSTVQAQSFSGDSRLPSSSVTLAEQKYLFGGNNNPTCLPRGGRLNPESSSNESIISENTSSLQITQSMKYGVLSHRQPANSNWGPTIEPVISNQQENSEGPRSSCGISTPPLLQSQSKKSQSISGISSFRSRSLRKLRGCGRSLRRHHL